jgi:hypothetical protein
MENSLVLENKTKAQIEIIRQRALFSSEIAIISLDDDLWDRFILQAYLKNLLIFGWVTGKTRRRFGNSIQFFIADKGSKILWRILK